jgi:hypothetical protein
MDRNRKGRKIEGKKEEEEWTQVGNILVLLDSALIYVLSDDGV